MSEDKESYEPVPLHCHKCGAVAVMVTAGWMRRGTKGKGGEEKMESWRKPTDADFNLLCRGCGGTSWDGKDLREIVSLPPDGFCEYDCFALKDPSFYPGRR